MWLLNNDTPFAAERTWVRDCEGAEVWVVAVKGSFIVGRDGIQTLDPVPREIRRVPIFRGAPEASSLVGECDLVHRKSMTDVLVEGDAVCPRGRLATKLDVRLRVASIDKTLRAHGERTCDPGVLGLRLGAPSAFARLPISYEFAFGGTGARTWEARNPVGRGFAEARSDLAGRLAPNVEDARFPFEDHDTGRPVGFGPIARHWAPRVALAGTYDDSWEASRKPLLPENFDDRFYQCAPEDQRVGGFLKGGEGVEVSGMSEDGPLSFRLPRVPLVMTTSFYDGSSVEHRPVIHTLTIHPEERRFELVWHSHLPCHHKVQKLKVTRIVTKRRVNVPRADVDSGMWMPA